MKKLIALLLAAVMLMGLLSGCGEKDEKKILGTWTATVDMTQQVLDEMGEDAETLNFDGKLNVTLNMTFTEDGKVTLASKVEDTEAVKSFLVGIFDASFAEMAEYFDGMTTEEILESVGMDLDDLVADLMEEMEQEETNTYTLEDGIIKYGDGDQDPYHFDGDKLIVDEYTLTRK